MKISLDWLQDFIEFKEKDPHMIAKKITAHTAEVDAVEEQGAILKNCVVGKVMTLSKHPGADRLSLCDVKTDSGVKKVVCGGSNLRVGMNVAFAHAGARVRWHGTEMVTLEKTKIRGEESEGMICTAEELDLTTLFPESKEKVLIDMGDDAPVGKDLRSYLGQSDTVLHIDNHAITHRADLFSHIGFARECVAIGIAKWKKEPKMPSFTFPKTALPFALKVENPKLMPRYCACLIAIDGLGVTPDWMKKRLIATGSRPVNLPVDITNFVMMEIGVPLHSFDAGDIQGNVTMRASTKGESIVTLDQVKRDLPEGALILEDDGGIFDLLGIMGGLRSSTKESTRQIYLHSASLDPVSIRRAVIATGHRTDAATVYEKGVPPVITEHGFFRALELMLELMPGAKVVSKLETKGDNGKPKPIEMTHAKLTSMLGVDIPSKKVIKILEDLDCTVKTKNQKLKTKNYVVTPPLTRLGDIKGSHDIVEEVGRIYGYDAIEAVLPSASISPPERDFRLCTFRDGLKEERYIELLPLCILGRGSLQKSGLDPSKAVKIANPIGEELSLLHTSTLPGLLEHASRNILESGDTQRTFTVAHVFEKGKEEHEESGILFLSKHPKNLKEEPVLQLKQHVCTALRSVGYHAIVARAKDAPAYGHPGRTATIAVQGKEVGMITELNPAILTAFGLPGRAATASINWSQLKSLKPETVVAKSVPAFPAISYDVTMPVDHRTEVSSLLERARAGSECIESVDVADVYGAAQSSTYNLTLRFTYRAKDRTLTEAEVQPIHAKILQSLQAKGVVR
ncbi:MAG TPA: phenylalanine--tRNA ligase subunit beta [Candidatus Peribacteraceae bacterium]|nr:phenylalanine--tRNA ligase subunit beta [Candidatus Peribacteraceae bacterium]